MLKHVGILTSGGDCPGLNAAIRGVGKAARDVFQMELIGFRDGFRGLVHDRTVPLESAMLSGILTTGGTILGTSRDKPHQMTIGGEVKKLVAADHPWVESARLVGTSFGECTQVARSQAPAWERQ